MVSYFVRYRGNSSDPAAFATYYREQHAAILKQFPSINSLILHSPAAFRDPFPVRPAGTMLLAQMTFDSTTALDAALRSDARRLARDDFARFPAFDGEVTHEALRAEVIF
jgi:uncharacterized protein (TIGR02118 family)